MILAFIPKETDKKITTYYPSGNIQEEFFLRNEVPANGWSRKLFYENGTIQLVECYSQFLVIEQLHYDEANNLLAHKIYSHKQKQLIDKPKQTITIRPNVVMGSGHIGYYFEHLPAISKFIEADYNEADLEQAYQDFITLEDKADKQDENEVKWVIKGKEMQFAFWFEKGEAYYQWHLWTNDEISYQKAKHFMQSLV
jgi:hypothetical protein